MLVIIAVILAIGFLFLTRQLAVMNRNAIARHEELVTAVQELNRGLTGSSAE